MKKTADFLLEEGEKPYNIRHRSFQFAKEIVLFVKDCQYEKVFSSLFDQLVRSASSIGANLVEGKAGSSRKDWRKFLVISLKSANETKYWICLIRDTMVVDKVRLAALLKEADEISKIVAAILLNADKEQEG